LQGWIIGTTDKYERCLKKFAKKRPNELAAVLNNLDTYFNTLQLLDHPLQIKAGFIHHEPKCIKAIDQKGGGKKVKLKETRLYIFPNCENKILHLLIIGDKTSQEEDIKYCLDFRKGV